MTEDEYVELTVKSNRVAYFLIGLILAAYGTFLAILIWQIDSNTHELVETYDSYYGVYGPDPDSVPDNIP